MKPCLHSKTALHFLTACTLVFSFSVPVIAQDTVQVTWFGTLSGSQIAGTDVTAGCALESFDISLSIVAPGSNWAGDMALGITAPNGNRIEVGGYNTGFGCRRLAKLLEHHGGWDLHGLHRQPGAIRPVWIRMLARGGDECLDKWRGE